MKAGACLCTFGVQVSVEKHMTAKLWPHLLDGVAFMSGTDVITGACSVCILGLQAVYVEKRMTAKLRPHQRDGVAFMFYCLAGLKDGGYTGSILMDGMGLGKFERVFL